MSELSYKNMEEQQTKPAPTAKDQLIEIADKAGVTVEDIVKLVIKATDGDVEFAKKQHKAMETLRRMQREQYELLKTQNDQLDERLRHFELKERMERYEPSNPKKETPQPTPPAIETVKPTIIIP